MIATAAKMVAYAKAPARTFMVLHPVRALKLGAAYVLVSRMLGRRTR